MYSKNTAGLILPYYYPISLFEKIIMPFTFFTKAPSAEEHAYSETVSRYPQDL
jgi:hypothetical protein